jgi:type II secretory pathway component PulF
MTRILIAFSNFMRDWGPWLLAALVISGILLPFLRNVDNRRRFHAFLLRMPP